MPLDRSLISAWSGRVLPPLFVSALIITSREPVADHTWMLVGLQVVGIALNLDVAFFWWFKVNRKGELRKK